MQANNRCSQRRGAVLVPLRGSRLLARIGSSGLGGSMSASLVAIWLLLTVAAGWWLVEVLKAKSYYDTVLKDQRAASFAIKSMDEQDRAFLSEVRSHWRCREDATNTETSQLLTAYSLTPSVQSMIRLLHSPLPQFSFSSARRNLRAYAFAHMRQVYSELLSFDTVTNQTIYLSEDGHLAFLRGSQPLSHVYVFQDELGGLREAHYYLKE